MKIVLIGGRNIPGFGGVESYMMNLAKELSNQGHEATIICCNDSSYETTIDNVSIIHMACPKQSIFTFPLLFLKSIGYILKNKKNIDVVNFQGTFLTFFSGWIARLCGCRVCYTRHSMAEDNPKYNKIKKFTIKTLSFISTWLCGKNIITISNSKAAEIKDRYGKSCTVIPCGVNIPQEKIDSNIIEKFGIAKGYYFLTIGRFDPIKNLDVLINAFKKTDNERYQLVIAGNYSNAYGEQLQQLAKENKNIIFVGGVLGDDKECLLRNCFVNCLVSSSEGMPISLLEAMVYGKHCIVTDIPAIREIAKDDWCYWCKPEDVDSLYSQLINAEKNHEIVAGENPEMVEYVERHHTWNSITKQYVAYLYSIGVKQKRIE